MSLDDVNDHLALILILKITILGWYHHCEHLDSLPVAGDQVISD